MKKYLLIGLITAFCQTAFSQEAKKDSVPKPAQSVYFELLGNGGTYSFNYDTRFNPKEAGIGGRFGVGYFANRKNSTFSVPVMLNYLAGGKNGQYFEFGGGLTFYSTKNTTFVFFEDR